MEENGIGAPAPGEEVDDTVCNLVRHLAPVAHRTPHKRAVVVPAGRDRYGRVSYTHQTFSQLLAEVETLTCGLRKIGVTPGMRVILMVRPGLEFLPLTFALFKVGAVPVLIDPGMGRRNLIRCIGGVRAEAFIGIPLAHAIRTLFPRAFRSVRIAVTIGRRWWWGGFDLDALRSHGRDCRTAPTAAGDEAALIFTTGSTGPPKGVVYTHGMFEAERELLRELLGITERDVDMPGFILFAIFSLAMGATVVIPDMDPTRPARVDPRRIIEAVENHGVTFCFGSPALWRTVSEYCVDRGVRFPSLTRVVMAGAPVPAYLHERLLDRILPAGADVYTPYGATEALPVTSITGREVLAETVAETRRGKGVCVGRPVAGVDLRVIRISDAPLPRMADLEVLPPGEIGEIIVSGPNVSPRYFELPEKTAEHKIYQDVDAVGGGFWHRMGDVGYRDADGRLWFCGRKAHRVVTASGTLFTVCCEAVINEHPGVYRSALVGVGDDLSRQTPVLLVEVDAASATGRSKELLEEVREMAAANPVTASIDHFLVHPGFPVDIRHNAKIFREKLRPWAAARVAPR